MKRVPVGLALAAAVLMAAPGARVEAEAPPTAAPGHLGVMVGPLSDEAAERTGVQKGAVVVQVMPDSPAAEAGLRAGDVITAVGDEDVRRPEDLVRAVEARSAGDRVRIAYRRGKKERSAEVVLAERPPRPEREGEGAKPFLGILAAPLTEEVREMSGARKGVLVQSVTDASPAAEAGLVPGDVITELDGQAVAGPEDLMERLRAHEPGDEIRVTYFRMGDRREARVVLGRAPGAEERPEPPLVGNEELLRRVPRLREYLEGMRPEIEEWMERLREGRGEEPRPPALEQPPHAGPDAYDLGKDIGRILERLERLEQRLNEIERRLERLERRGPPAGPR